MTARAARGLPRLTERKRAAGNRWRPKSREETPKEGDGNARRISTLPHCNNIHRAAQKSRPADHFPLILPANGAELCLPVRMTATDTGGSQKTEECQ